MYVVIVNWLSIQSSTQSSSHVPQKKRERKKWNKMNNTKRELEHKKILNITRGKVEVENKVERGEIREESES